MNPNISKTNDKYGWIGSNKSCWTITRSKYIFKNKSIKDKKDQPLLSVTQKDGVIKRTDAENKVWNPSEDISGYKLIEPGDFVISLRSFEGGIELSKLRGLVSPAYTVLENFIEIDKNFFRWMMKSNQFIIELNKHVSGIRQGKNIVWNDFANIYLLNPPLKVQRKISEYLDKKTAKIDRLITLLEQKVKLLEEKRRSLIDFTVTKGLDSSEEFKDSGIKWIGKIPKHWEVKRISTLYNQTSIRGYEHEENLSVFRDYGVVRRVDYENKNVLSENLSNYKLVKEGDLVLNKMKTWMGSLGVSNYRGIVSPAYYVLSPNFNFFSGYLHYLLRSKVYIDQYASVSKGVRPGQWDLSIDIFKTLKIILPPIDEQKKIYYFIENNLKRNSSLIELENRRIQNLKEYRKTLISELITGNITVTEDMI